MSACVFCQIETGESSLCRRCADLCVMIYRDTATAQKIVNFYNKPLQSNTEGATGTGYGVLAAADGVEGTFKRQSIP